MSENNPKRVRIYTERNSDAHDYLRGFFSSFGLTEIDGEGAWAVKPGDIKHEQSVVIEVVFPDGIPGHLDIVYACESAKKHSNQEEILFTVESLENAQFV